MEELGDALSLKTQSVGDVAPILLVLVLRGCFDIVLGGYFDINGMNVVGFLGVERNHRETATDVPSLDAGRLPRPGRAGLHGIEGFGGHLQPCGGIGETALLDAFFGGLPAIHAFPFHLCDSLAQLQVVLD